MSKKWYSLFVSVDQPSTPPPEGKQPAAPKSAAQTVAEIAASLGPAPVFKTPAVVQAPGSFGEIYRAAELPAPAHGYTILKVADMLQSEHIRGLPAEVRRSSVLLALEAAGVQINEVIQDAVRRDRALDAYEAVLQRSLDELEARKTEENRKIESELERLIAEHRARIQANSDEITREKERIYGWRLQKQQEEKKISDAVAYFVTENPISTGGPAPAPSPKVGETQP
jgi:hypothetical protein